MGWFLLRRLVAFPLLLLAVYTGAVLLVMAAPGDPLETGEKDLPLEVIQARRVAYNYDRYVTDANGIRRVEPVPWWERYYWLWPKRLLWDGDLPAHRYEDWTVTEILRSALPVSLQLGVLALSLSVLIGLSVGVLSAVGRGGWLDHLSVALGLIGISLPTFVVGSVLVIVVGLWLKAVPVVGWGRPSQALLPALTLALPYAAYIARLTRAALLDAYAEDFVRTARAKGLSESRVLLDHALRHALLPVLSYLGPAAAAIFTGSFVVERVFAIPGMGTHVVESINNRDQSLILATVLVYASFLATFNLIVDCLYAFVDPRIRVGARAGA
ncbi:MAG: ABC transporter permease [Planctomycetes bacterium]|nr:ABC transporter permease [Planctomycetota bacterium]